MNEFPANIGTDNHAVFWELGPDGLYRVGLDCNERYTQMQQRINDLQEISDLYRDVLIRTAAERNHLRDALKLLTNPQGGSE